MNVKGKANDAISILNEIDTYDDALPDKLSLVDSKISDLMHLIEYNKLKTNQCYRVVRELHNLRQERRRIKIDMELIRVYKTHANKLLSKDNRIFILSELGKTEKKLNSKYNNRIYTEEELNEMVGV